MQRWLGKVAVVTGANAGIGSAICFALADCVGMTVVGLDRTEQKVDKLQSQIKGIGCITMKQCDVSNPKELSDIFQWIEKEYRGVDVLVNNAGALYDGQITVAGDKVLTEEQIVNTISTNVTGLVLCTRHAVKSMKDRCFDGHIFNISSVVGHYIPTTQTFNVYPCTKHAVTAFKGSLNNEFAKFCCRIKVTNINPGLVQTNLASGLIDQLKVPFLHPPDIADGVLYALSTPPHVNVTELTISAVAQPFL